jgi:KamA family protein
MPQPKYLTSIDHIPQLSDHEREALKNVTEKFVFRINDYYLNLIDWNDPDDPIRKLIIPREGELQEYGRWDASDEEANYVVDNCQHKYRTTALLLVSTVCGAYCRYCFRKRLFRDDVKEVTSDLDPAIEYIRLHSEISNVLLTGGDPLVLATKKIKNLLDRLQQIDHVSIVRFGSKMPVFNPMRIYEDEELLERFRQFHSPQRKIYVVAHINHPREITPEAEGCFVALQQAGVVMVNQTPILRGINDNSDVLAELLDRLAATGVTPYYFFVNRPVAGNADFVLPLTQLYRLVEEAKAKTSGLGKRVRLVMSHSSGKIEILAIENGMAYLKYHQSREGEYGKLMVLPCPKDASWFDDLPGNDTYWNSPVKKQSSY